MKDKHVKRGITNYTKRLQRESLGKTARIRKQETEDEEDQTGSKARNQSISSFQDKLRYIVVLVGVALIIGLTSFVVNSIKNAKETEKFVSDEEAVLKIKHPNEMQAIELAKRFFEAIDVNQWADITYGNQDELSLAFAQLADMKKNGWKAKTFQHIGPRQASDGFVDSLLIMDALGDAKMMNLVYREAAWKIDPGSTLQMHSKNWEEFFNPASTSGMVRVMLTDDANYYNGKYDDESIWHAYTVKYRGDLRSIIGYVKRGSSCDVALQDLLKESATTPCVLNLHRDVEAEKEQYEIESVVSSDWVVSGPIFSDQFIDQSDSSVPTGK